MITVRIHRVRRNGARGGIVGSYEVDRPLYLVDWAEPPDAAELVGVEPGDRLVILVVEDGRTIDSANAVAR